MIPILTDLRFDPHPLYHASPKIFDFPDRHQINLAREWSQWHANGVLGLWCSTFPQMCASFGKYVYEVEMHSESRVIGLPFGPFCTLTSPMEDFTDLIEYLTREGDVAYLVDANPYVGEVIILNFDHIARFENVSGQDLQDKRYPMTSKQVRRYEGR